MFFLRNECGRKFQLFVCEGSKTPARRNLLAHDELNRGQIDRRTPTRTAFFRPQRCALERKNERKPFWENPISTWIKIGVSTFVKLCVRSERLAEASVQIYLSESFLHPPSFLFNFTLKRSPASENAFQLNNWWILITSQRGLDSLPSQPKVICCGKTFLLSFACLIHWSF